MTESRDKQLFNCKCLECDHCLRFGFCISVMFPPVAPVQKMVKCIAKLFKTLNTALSVHTHTSQKIIITQLPGHCGINLALNDLSKTQAAFTQQAQVAWICLLDGNVNRTGQKSDLDVFYVRIQTPIRMQDYSRSTSIINVESQTKTNSSVNSNLLYPENLDEIGLTEDVHIMIPPLLAQPPLKAIFSTQKLLLFIFLFPLICFKSRLLPLHNNIKMRFYTPTPVDFYL